MKEYNFTEEELQQVGIDLERFKVNNKILVSTVDKYLASKNCVKLLENEIISIISIPDFEREREKLWAYYRMCDKQEKLTKLSSFGIKNEF